MNSMKKINAYMQLLLLSVVLLSISCTGDFENMNRNPNEVTDGQMDALNYKIGTKFQSLQGLVVPVQEHMYQFNESLSGGPFGGYIGATVDSWLTKFETFNPSADWRKWPFANVITETYTPWRGIVTGTDDEVAVAFAKLLRVAIMHRVTDSYGPIPYSNLETNESITVKYDKQEEVYMKMFGELDEAIAAYESAKKQLEIASDESMMRFKVKFEDFQNILGEMFAIMAGMDGEKVEKCVNALKVVLRERGL